jgi:hypothetical protein
MRKFILLSLLVLGLGAVYASAQCTRCSYQRNSNGCTYDSYTGGCGCISGFNGRVHICATCGFCTLQCLYGCQSAPSAALPSAVPLVQQPWISNATISSRVAQQSPTMASLLSFVRDTLAAKTCVNWQGIMVDADGRTFDWGVTSSGGVTDIFATETTGVMQSKERLTLGLKSWSLTRGTQVIVKEPLL